MTQMSSTKPAARRAPVGRNIDLRGLAAAALFIAPCLGMLVALWRVCSTLDPRTLSTFLQ